MMTSRRPRDLDGGSPAHRRGHANQLSISDTSDHITETIGTMYGEDDDYPNESRPSSLVAQRGGEHLSDYSDLDLSPAEEHGLRLVLSSPSEIDPPNGASPNNSDSSPIPIQGQKSLSRSNSKSSAMSPVSPSAPMSPTLRDMRNDPDAYPLTNIDNPNDIAQELSNLQAIRRLSMDVSNNSDPDLLPFQGMSLMAMPSIAPRGDDDADPSRLLWVPAGVHPELAPSEFKTFVQKRVQSMKRRSSENSLSPDSFGRGDSGGLRRKKSMLSRQVETSGHAANGFIDGAETLERRRSRGPSESGSAELSLDELMKDPGKAVRKLTLESQGGSDNSSDVDDMPILPVAPGAGLRRSTRTTYRKGGSLKNRQGSVGNIERLPFAQRMAVKRSEGGDVNLSITESPLDVPADHNLVRVQSEPVLDHSSSPSVSVREQHLSDNGSMDAREYSMITPIQEQDQSQPAQSSASNHVLPEKTPSFTPAPPITEASVEQEAGSRSHEVARPYPERTSSQRAVTRDFTHQQPGVSSESPSRSKQRPPPSQPYQASSQPQAANVNAQSRRSPAASSQNIDGKAQASPSFVPGSASRTDTLTFIPTFSPSEEKRSDDKRSGEKKTDKRSKKDSSESGSSKGSSWKWFKSEEREKRKKEEEARKSKAKGSVDKTHDNVRLDVLQTSIDTASHKGRESLLLDRDSVEGKLDEERRKESSRKSGEHKKEKDGLFSSIFGGSRRKGEKDSGNRKSHSQRPLSPDPAPYRPLRPDTDYPWTRFPILEERAIYRMAHIKLANPRRGLHSQVLLSNFMYAYLAKVQALNPQIQVPQSPQQKRLQEEERRRREQEQQYAEQQQAQDSIDRYNFEYHRVSPTSALLDEFYANPDQSASQYSDPNMQQEQGDYLEGDDMFDDDHGTDTTGNGGGGGGGGAYGDGNGGTRDQYSYDNQNGQRHDKEDMW
ncbi:hypothetical protein GGS21DRAFT_520027 [Xylaria nigripes]|nr:hypothetical protein GGS21DRAFT_520027 [Xylaria nigripes]